MVFRIEKKIEKKQYKKLSISFLNFYRFMLKQLRKDLQKLKNPKNGWAGPYCETVRLKAGLPSATA